MRIICLDIGSKRIGIAASDPYGWTAGGLCVLDRKGDKKDFEEIAKRCRELDADVMVIGIPLDEEGNVGPAAKRVKDFAERLSRYLADAGIDLAYELWDERYSTARAEERLIGADVSRAKRRRVIDKMAAAVILEDYLKAKDLPPGENESAEG